MHKFCKIEKCNNNYILATVIKYITYTIDSTEGSAYYFLFN